MIDDPVSTHKYKIYDVDMLPKVILGINVKNKYDENRLNIKSKYKPVYISHFQTVNNVLQPSYYYGIELSLKREYKTMMSEFAKSSVLCNKDTLPSVQLDAYKKVLNKYDLTCNTCYGYYNDGTWPIDLCHLQKITNRDFSDEIKTGFMAMLKSRKDGEPVFTKLINFNILILAKSIGYDN